MELAIKQCAIKILHAITGKLGFSTIFTVLIFYCHCQLVAPIWQVSTINFTFFKTNFSIINFFLQIKEIYLLLSLGAIFLSLFMIYGTFFEVYIRTNKNKEDISTFEVLTPNLPWDKNKLQIILGLVHNKDNLNLVKNPNWLVVEEKGMFQNFLISGSIGTGKTASVLYPLTKQAMFYQHDNQKLKAGMLVLDVKGNYYKQVLKYAKECGRSDDVILIELGGKYNYNPIHKPNMEVIDIAARARTVLDLFNSGGKKDAFWDTKAGQMMAECLRLLRLTDDYVTLTDVHYLVTNKNFLNEKLVQLEEIRYTNPKQINDFDYFSCTNYFKGEFVSSAKNTIETIKACVTEMTGLFASSELVSKTFCPPKNQLNFTGFANLINSGKIVVLGLKPSTQPKIASTIAAFMKLDFQAEVQSRTADTGLNTTRPVFFICDEYQWFVTANDGDFYGVSREANCCSIVASQSYTSLSKALGDEKVFNVLQQNMLNKIWLRTDDKLTIDMAQMLTGKENKAQYSKNISESAGDSKRSALFGKLVADKASISESLGISTKQDFVFDTKIFTQVLENFKAIAFVSNGGKMQEPTLVHLQPYFLQELDTGIAIKPESLATISFKKTSPKPDALKDNSNHSISIIEETDFKETDFKETGSEDLAETYNNIMEDT